jgi:GrpB-like predicted nucleotidyltransferase (UPF0157 family)
MSKEKSIKELRLIPSIGKSIANDLWNIGITCPNDLIGKDPDVLFIQSNRYAGMVQDRCLLYAFRCAVYYTETKPELRDPEKLQWWKWKDHNRKGNNSPVVQDLNELSSKKLGQLFPVEIVPYNPTWHYLFLTEKADIDRIISPFALTIEHFGSTAIHNMASKPTIDILVAISDQETIKPMIIEKMKAHGYHFTLRKDSPPPYMMFMKGYTSEGFNGQSYHIHMAPLSHTGLWDRILFRDYLISHPKEAHEYEKLKFELARRFRNDREAYTNGKTDFIQKVMAIIKPTNNEK